MNQVGGWVTGLWGRLMREQPPPPTWVLLATAAIALYAVTDRRTWLLTRHVVTLAHEGGHAAVALLAGRRLQGVRLHSDTSGLTVSSGRPTGPGMIATGAAGYPAPALLGLAAASALSGGHAVATLWGFIALLVAILVAVRNAFGMLSVTTTGAILAGVSIWAPTAVQGGFAYLLAWFLLLAGPRPVFELQRKRRHGQAPTSDADQLARLTRVPGLVWVGVFLVITLAGLAAGAWLLVTPALR